MTIRGSECRLRRRGALVVAICCAIFAAREQAAGGDDVSYSRPTRMIVARIDGRMPVAIEGPGAALLHRQATVFDLRPPDLSIDGRAEWRFFGIENELRNGPGDVYQPLRQRFDSARRKVMPAHLLVPRGCGIAAILPLRGDAAAPQERPDRSLGPIQIVARGTFIGWTALTIDIAALDLEEQTLPIHLRRFELREMLEKHRVGNLRLTSDPDGGSARGSFDPPKSARSLLAIVRSEVDWQGTLERLEIWRSGEYERRVFFGEVAPDGSAILEADETARQARFLPARCSFATTAPIHLPDQSELVFHAGCVDAARIDLEVEVIADGDAPRTLFSESLSAGSWLASDREIRIDLSTFAQRRVRFKFHSRSREEGSRGVAVLVEPRVEGAADANAARLTDSLVIVVDDLPSESMVPTADPCAGARMLRSLAGRFGAQPTTRSLGVSAGAIEFDSGRLLEVSAASSPQELPVPAGFAAAGGRVIAITDEDPGLLDLGCDEVVSVDPALDSGAFERTLERIAARPDLPHYVFVRSRAIRTGAMRGAARARWLPTEPSALLESVDAALGDVLRAWIDRGRFDRSRIELLTTLGRDGQPTGVLREP